MKILQVHNYYQFPGGEDNVFQNEKNLLLSKGHEVIEFTRHNKEIKNYNLLEKAKFAINSIYNFETKKMFNKFLNFTKPDVVHFHNIFPLISPSVYYACREAGVPVIQSLHNPRLLCPSATLYRNGQTCEKCLGKTLPWPSLRYACYRKSYIQTAVVTAMLIFHRLLKTWQKQVDTYIVFTEFYRRKFIEGGLPSNKIIIKPHFIHPDPGLTSKKKRNYALYIGRLDPEKGVFTLLQAWQKLKIVPLKIRGDGRLLTEIQYFLKKNHLESVEIVGRLSNDELIVLIKGARFLIWPSEGYYETFGLVAIEAFACGVPVIASRLGVIAEIVENGRTGLYFKPGDPDDLATKIQWAIEHPDEMREMGINARREYEAKYTAERNYKLLMEIYKKALKH